MCEIIIGNPFYLVLMRNCTPLKVTAKPMQFGGLIYKFGLAVNLLHTLLPVGQVITE